MLTATCDQCGTTGQFPPFLIGQRVKCKACQSGWVQLPPPDFVPLPKLPPVATLVPPPKAKLVPTDPDAPPQARRVADAPPPAKWKPKHAATRPSSPNDPVQPDPPGTVRPSPDQPAARPFGLTLSGIGMSIGSAVAVFAFGGAQPLNDRLLYGVVGGLIGAALGAGLTWMLRAAGGEAE